MGEFETWVCITVENSPNPSSVYIRIWKHKKKSFLFLLSNNFPKKKSKPLFFRALIKREILTSHKVLYTKLVHIISPCFAKKKLSKIRVFLACFFLFQPMRKWVNRVNMLSLLTQNLFQIHACMIGTQQPKHLDITTMFTYSHANTRLGQSERAYFLSYFII